MPRDSSRGGGTGLNRAIRVVLATGDERLDDYVAQVPGVRVLRAVYYKEGVLSTLQELREAGEVPDVLMISENLDGDGDIRDLLREIRLTSYETRIIFIFDNADEDNVLSMRHFLLGLQIYDTLGDHPDGFGPEEVLQALLEPRSPLEVMRELAQLSRGEDIARRPPHPLSGYGASSPGAGTERTQPAPQNLRVELTTDVVPVTAFWSAKGGEGVDTLAVNVAIAVAQAAPDLMVCIVDLARTPNVHLHFNVFDEDRNLETVLDLARRNRLSPHTIQRYVIEHQKIRNLWILPGSIRTINFDQELEGRERDIETLIAVLRSVYDCVILVLSSDMPSLSFPPTLVGLQKADQILMVLTEDHASLYNARRALDPEYGRLQARDIDMSKIRFVLNKYLAVGTGLREQMLRKFGQEPAAVVPMFAEILSQAMAEARPLMMQADLPEEVQAGFHAVANLICPRFTLPAPTPERRGFLARLMEWLRGLLARGK